MNLTAVLFLVSLVVFLLALFGVHPEDVNMTLLGLAFLAAGLLASAAGYARIGD